MASGGRVRVAQTDLQPGRNYIIRGVQLRLGVDIDSPNIHSRPYNDLYYETDSEDLALGFVRNHRGRDIDPRTIRSNVHFDDEDEEDLLVSEFTEVVRLNGSTYRPFLSTNNVRFITPMSARIEFYEALPTDIEAPPPEIPVASEVDVELATPSSSDYPEYVTDGDSVQQLEITDGRWVGGKTKRKRKIRKTKKTLKSKRKPFKTKRKKHNGD
jgi:hypothetical protein